MKNIYVSVSEMPVLSEGEIVWFFPESNSVRAKKGTVLPEGYRNGYAREGKPKDYHIEISPFNNFRVPRGRIFTSEIRALLQAQRNLNKYAKFLHNRIGEIQEN